MDSQSIWPRHFAKSAPTSSNSLLARGYRAFNKASSDCLFELGTQLVQTLGVFEASFLQTQEMLAAMIVESIAKEVVEGDFFALRPPEVLYHRAN